MAKKDDEVWWDFPGYTSEDEGQPVQDWIDSLSDDALDEVVNLLNNQAVLPKGLWARPEFDPLKGECGISELRANEVRGPSGAEIIRLYGWFGPRRTDYTILHGTNKGKGAKNDRIGKQIACERLARLRAGKAGPQELDFPRKPHQPVTTGSDAPGKVPKFKSRTGTGVPDSPVEKQEGLESAGTSQKDGDESKRNF
jgi:hypothetical protein